jgi:hypothetical protein
MASRLLPDAAGDSSSKHSRQEGRLYPAGVPSAAGAGRCQRCTPRRPGLCLLPVPQPVQCCCSPGGRARSRARTPGRLVGSGGYGETLGYAPWLLRLSARSPPGQSPSEGASSGWLPLPLQPVRLLRPSAGACSARALPTSMAMASNRPAIACGAHAHFASNPSPHLLAELPRALPPTARQRCGPGYKRQQVVFGSEQLIEQPAQRQGAKAIASIRG